MKAFLHSAQGPMPLYVEMTSTATVRETLAIFAEEGDGLWIEEGEMELEAEVTLEEVGVCENDHLHHHRCREVSVTVRYVDEDRREVFSPAVTVASVLKWALSPRGFDIPGAEHPEFGFLNCDDGKTVTENTHIGSLTGPGHGCEVCLSLVKKHNPQG